MVTGQSVMDYLVNTRIKISTLLLKDTSLSISEIAERLGYSDSSHFYKMFRKITGYSPTQYRSEFKIK